MPMPARPWPRFLARHFDVLLFGIIAGVLLAVLDPSFYESSDTVGKNNDAVFSFLIILAWMPIETICLAKAGTTPGKAILGIRVINKDGNKPTFGQAFSRSFLVWRGGMACGFPVINLITEAVAYRKLTKTGSTSWDSRLQLAVSQESISMTRQLAFGVLLLGLVALLIFGSMQ